MNKPYSLIVMTLLLVLGILAAAFVMGLVEYGIETSAHRRALAAEKPFDQEHVDLAEAQGNRIVEALFAFRGARGKFPASLDELVPEFLPRIEPPAAGAQWWEYGVGPDGEFGLGFGTQAFGVGNLYPCHSTGSSKPGEWYRDY